MATQRHPGLTYDDLLAFPEDNLRRELIDGELIVTAAPGGRHQDAVLELASRLLSYARHHGGKVYVAPRDVYFNHTSVVEPDAVFVREENLARLEEAFVRGAPDLVVEVSSPSTRRLELVRKRELYQRFGVPEFWYVDLDADRVEVYRLDRGRHVHPAILERREALSSPLLPGFEIPLDKLLGPPGQ